MSHLMIDLEKIGAKSEKINLHLLDSIFHGVSGDYRKIVSDFARLPMFYQDNSASFKILVHRNRVVYACVESSGGGSTRISVYFLRDEIEIDGNMDFSPKDTYRRVDIPTILLKGNKKCLFTLYQIRFAIYDTLFEAESSLPLKHGYIGITKRHFFSRFKEHELKARNGKGHLLHTAWKALLDSGINFCPVIQLAGFADDLDSIYDMEEEAVARLTKQPKGLNVIDGGYAGIQELHRLGLLARENRVPLDERNTALERLNVTYGKSPHFRCGHIRNLTNNRKTWVSPCWVNGNHAEA